jgi:septum formation protein
MGATGKVEMRLILASSSPRRREILSRLGIPFEVVAPGHLENHPPGEEPDQICSRLAREKAELIATDFPEDLIIAADTIVILDNQILGKPKNTNEAREMLLTLSGKTHMVKTAVAFLNLHPGHQSGFVETTRVTFADIDDEDIQPYLRLDPPLDKAGAYGSTIISRNWTFGPEFEGQTSCNRN